MKKSRFKADSIEVQESRRALAIETLNAAMKKDRISMRIALLMLAEGKMLNPEEKELAEDVISMIDRFNERIMDLFGKKPDERVFSMHLSATTLAEEIEVFRESSFWLLDKNGVLQVEQAISRLVSIYQHARRLVRLMIAADSVISLPEDPARIAEIPVNRYLRHTHPELCK